MWPNARAKIISRRISEHLETKNSNPKLPKIEKAEKK